jgi:hypothetical protein
VDELNSILPGDAQDQGWFPVQAHSSDYKNIKRIEEIRTWILVNIKYNDWTEWYGVFWFKNEKDASMFTLRWM